MRFDVRCLLIVLALLPLSGSSNCALIPCTPESPFYDPATGLCTTQPNGTGGGFGPAVPGSGGLPTEPGTNPSSDPGDNANNVNLDVFGLNGRWMDGAREICLQHFGASVHAWYLELFMCDHQDGTGGFSNTETDFRGNLVNGVITGTTSACRFGHPSGNGIIETTMTLTVSEDGKTLSGTWFNPDENQDIPFTVTRISVGNCSRPSF